MLVNGPKKTALPFTVNRRANGLKKQTRLRRRGLHSLVWYKTKIRYLVFIIQIYLPATCQAILSSGCISGGHGRGYLASNPYGLF